MKLAILYIRFCKLHTTKKNEFRKKYPNFIFKLEHLFNYKDNLVLIKNNNSYLDLLDEHILDNIYRCMHQSYIQYINKQISTLEFVHVKFHVNNIRNINEKILSIFKTINKEKKISNSYRNHIIKINNKYIFDYCRPKINCICGSDHTNSIYSKYNSYDNYSCLKSWNRNGFIEYEHNHNVKLCKSIEYDKCMQHNIPLYYCKDCDVIIRKSSVYGHIKSLKHKSNISKTNKKHKKNYDNNNDNLVYNFNLIKPFIIKYP